MHLGEKKKPTSFFFSHEVKQTKVIEEYYLLILQWAGLLQGYFNHTQLIMLENTCSNQREREILLSYQATF